MWRCTRDRGGSARHRGGIAARRAGRGSVRSCSALGGRDMGGHAGDRRGRGAQGSAPRVIYGGACGARRPVWALRRAVRQPKGDTQCRRGESPCLAPGSAGANGITSAPSCAQLRRVAWLIDPKWAAMPTSKSSCRFLRPFRTCVTRDPGFARLIKFPQPPRYVDRPLPARGARTGASARPNRAPGGGRAERARPGGS